MKPDTFVDDVIIRQIRKSTTYGILRETTQTKLREVKAANSLIMQRVLNPVKIVSRDLHEDESSDEEEWLSQEPDITIDEEPGTSGPSPCEKAVDPTVRKRTQPMPVYTPDRCKTPRLDDKTNDPTCKVADKAVQTDPVVYTKSIKTTTIVREHGRKTITVKREKML